MVWRGRFGIVCKYVATLPPGVKESVARQFEEQAVRDWGGAVARFRSDYRSGYHGDHRR